MKTSLEISLYPLHEQYEAKVIEFIHQLRTYDGLHCETNGMSTQVFGDYDSIMAMLNTELKRTFQDNECVVVMKMAQGELRKEGLPNSLK